MFFVHEYQIRLADIDRAGNNSLVLRLTKAEVEKRRVS
jgi:hypothetical protein